MICNKIYDTQDIDIPGFFALCVFLYIEIWRHNIQIFSFLDFWYSK